MFTHNGSTPLSSELNFGGKHVVTKLKRGYNMLNKAIEHGKEYRKPYRKSKAFDFSCRNHGSCGYCYDNRTFSNRRRAKFANDDLREYLIDEKV